MVHKERLVRMVVAGAAALAVVGCSGEGAGAPTTPAGQASGTGTGADPSAQQVDAASTPTVLVLDSSGSMVTDDAPGSRLDAAKAAAGTVIDTVPDGTPFAAVAYGAHTTNEETAENKARSCKDITTLVPRGPIDRAAAKEAVSTLEPGGYTPIGASLQAAARMVPTGPAVIVLLTDGIDNCAPPDPCATARQLKQHNPDLQVSVVGFRTSGEQLRCIADATGGFFTTADNSAQLATRMGAARQPSTAHAALGPDGIHGVDLGQTIPDIRRAHPDFPATGTTSSDGTVIIEWRDCAFTFTDGKLTAIAPEQTTTIDGLTVGSSISQARSFYGDPVSADPASGGGTVSVFRAGLGDAAAGWQVATDAGGRITRIVLCRCLPAGGSPYAAQPSDGSKAGLSGATLTGSAVITHPSWGRVTIATFMPPDGPGDGAVMVFDTSGRVLWSEKVTGYKFELAKPAQDSTGNVFLIYNPGRYDGVQILRPTSGGFDVIAGNYDDPRGIDFYYAELKGPGADGRYTIVKPNNDCNPSCAGGTVTSETYRWDGSTYVVG